MSSDASTRQRIREILVESLRLEGTTPESIGDESPLWGDGLGLDSVDALELMVALEQEYGFRIESEEIDLASLANVARLAEFVESLQASQVSAGTAAKQESGSLA
jgi:acyl carrier protein